MASVHLEDDAFYCTLSFGARINYVFIETSRGARSDIYNYDGQVEEDVVGCLCFAENECTAFEAIDVETPKSLPCESRLKKVFLITAGGSSAAPPSLVIFVVLVSLERSSVRAERLSEIPQNGLSVVHEFV